MNLQTNSIAKTPKTAVLFGENDSFINGQVLLAQPIASERILTDLGFTEFAESYNNLAVDAYMKEGDDYRERRFSEFRIQIEENYISIFQLPQRAFTQSTELNEYSGGQDRHYEPLERHIANSRFLHQLMIDVFLLLPDHERQASDRWDIGVHFYRIIGKPNETGLPAPEGAHQDGHNFTSITLIGRTNVEGGESLFLDFDKNVNVRHTLTCPIETALFDDRRGFHDVTPVQSKDGFNRATRDVCGFSLNPTQSSHQT